MRREGGGEGGVGVVDSEGDVVEVMERGEIEGDESEIRFIFKYRWVDFLGKKIFFLRIFFLNDNTTLITSLTPPKK